MVRKLHKIHCSRFLCTLCTVTIENSIVLQLFYLYELRQQCKRDWALRVCFDCWFEVFQYLWHISSRVSNRKRLCSVVWPYQMSFKKLCARSPPSGLFVHYIWSLPAFLNRVSSINYACINLARTIEHLLCSTSDLNIC